MLLPQGSQSDIQFSKDLVQHLGIPSITINIGQVVTSLTRQLSANCIPPSAQTCTNLPARIRMAALFAAAQSVNGRVANTCNLSEDYVGYSTLFGDNAGHFSPLAELTATEVKQLGRALHLPDHLVEKPPADGLCGKTDEENLGFSYDTLDDFIRTGNCPDPNLKARFVDLNDKNRFKTEMVCLPHFSPRKGHLFLRPIPRKRGVK